MLQKSSDEKIEVKSKINEEIFVCLRKLSNQNENRVTGSVNFLRRLFNGKTTKNEYLYSLKRLIRGVGSSTTESRAGFFISLIGLLDFSSDDDFDCDQILDLAAKELGVGTECSNKEDADAIVGIILVCSSLIRSNKFKKLSNMNLTQISTMLINSSKSKTYNKMLAFKIFVELLQVISEKQFENCVFPVLKDKIEKLGYKYDVFTTYFLIEIFKKFPNFETVDLKLNLSYSKIIYPENFEYLSKCLIENSMNVMQPAFDSVCIYIANFCLKGFWQKLIKINLINKNNEQNLLKMMTIFFTNSSEQSLSYVLSANMITIISKGLKNSGKNKEKNKVIYDNFFDALILYCNKSNTTSEERLAIIQKLILHPGLLTIETYTSKKIIHQIISKCNENSVKQLYEIYKQILLNNKIKNPNDTSEEWSDSERSHAGYMMQYLLNQKAIQSSCKWKTQELNSIMILGFFYTNNELEILEKDKANFDEKLADQMRNIFFSSLQHKHSTLENESKTLLHLVKTCNGILKKKNFDRFFRFEITKNIIKIWNEMYTEIQKLETLKSKSSKKPENQLDYVFNVLLMHMGLQLFRNSEMAETAITDLEMCIIKSKEKFSSHENKKKSKDQNKVKEPEWIEVVVDLFLHLLSQNSNSLRIIVNSVFPHLCKFLTRSSMLQILEMLMLKDGFNPLVDDQETFSANNDSNSEKTIKNSHDTNSEESDNSSDEKNNDNSSDISKSDSNGESDDDNNSQESENSSSEENDANMEEDQAEAEKFRNAVSLALNTNDLNDDGDSVDLDDMDEEVGHKLDEALSEIFKMKKETSKKNKRSKTYRTESTTLLHFRIRVLDLIDIYIDQTPSLNILLEIVKSLYDSLEHSSNKELTPLFIKIEKLLNKITNMRKNIDIENFVSRELISFFTYVLNKKFKSKSNDIQNKMRCKCLTFLIHLNNSCLNQKNFDKEIIHQLQNSINTFVLSKNSIFNIYFFKCLFNICWIGIWNLAITGIDSGLNILVTPQRRINILELLELLYKNNQLIKQNNKLALENFQIIETKIEQFLKNLVNQDNFISKEFSALINLLSIINNFHKKNQSKFSFNQQSLCENVQLLRSKIKIENLQNYHKFCSIFNLEPINYEENLKVGVNNKNQILNIGKRKSTTDNKKISKKPKKQ